MGERWERESARELEPWNAMGLMEGRVAEILVVTNSFYKLLLIFLNKTTNKIEKMNLLAEVLFTYQLHCFRSLKLI